MLAGMMDRRGLTPVPLQWAASRVYEDKHNRVGEKAERRRQEKLPTEETFAALAEISCRTDLPEHDFAPTTRLGTLMCGGSASMNCSPCTTGLGQ
jgi:hypothetical protein